MDTLRFFCAKATWDVIVLHYLRVRLIQLTGFVPNKQTMCPDVFRGPWGGSHCRDSPVQTTRECSCAQGIKTHSPIAQAPPRRCSQSPHQQKLVI